MLFISSLLISLALQDVAADQDQLTSTKLVRDSSLSQLGSSESSLYCFPYYYCYVSVVQTHGDSTPKPAMKICQQPHLRGTTIQLNLPYTILVYEVYT